ncbi:hypothetical protein J5N97_015424 [Dioscorea zingiberensis]|uniref:GDSL esterase/lipase n=1 Tax=Dioscorea zingiberensis TaxID=325984 RepID=A0A9D5HKG2_9LILI|nr:hypothetical protein J5N97_015424 [Dioscorea zingiberensis]
MNTEPLVVVCWHRGDRGTDGGEVTKAVLINNDTGHYWNFSDDELHTRNGEEEEEEEVGLDLHCTLGGQELGLKNWAPPYLAPSSVGPAVLQGVNYASGGGGILLKTGKFFGGSLNLYTQIDYYTKTRQDIISSLGSAAALRLLRKEALFSVTIGSNDFINNYLIPILSIPKRATVSPEMFVESMISGYRQQLTRLYYLDARKILITNVGPIGCIPYMREQSSQSSTNCFDFANQVTEYFNRRLKDLVMELSSTLDESIFVYANVYNIVSDIIQNYRKYGFKVVDSACCSFAGRYGGLIPCNLKSKLCSDRTKYVFWDPYHPTEAANIIIAKSKSTPQYFHAVGREVSVPSLVDKFGWCTWNAFYLTVEPVGVWQGVKNITGGIRLRFLIIDDGWQSFRMDGDTSHERKGPYIKRNKSHCWALLGFPPLKNVTTYKFRKYRGGTRLTADA